MKFMAWVSMIYTAWQLSYYLRSHCPVPMKRLCLWTTLYTIHPSSYLYVYFFVTYISIYLDFTELIRLITDDPQSLDVIQETCESSSLDEGDGDVETEMLTETTPEESTVLGRDYLNFNHRYRKPSTNTPNMRRLILSTTASTSESNNSDSSIQSYTYGQVLEQIMLIMVLIVVLTWFSFKRRHS